MLNQLRPALVSLTVFTVLTGVIYPLLTTGVAQIFFPAEANGSLVTREDRAIGSSLVGQYFDDPKYFWGRSSATTPTAYNAAASSGSNLGPTNPALIDAVKQRREALHKADPGNGEPVPVDLVTASASGLDPHISPKAAEYQISRVARARGLDEASVRRFVAQHTQGRTIGLLGEPRVNVLEVNLALEAQR